MRRSLARPVYFLSGGLNDRVPALLELRWSRSRSSVEVADCTLWYDDSSSTSTFAILSFSVDSIHSFFTPVLSFCAYRTRRQSRIRGRSTCLFQQADYRRRHLSFACRRRR